METISLALQLAALVWVVLEFTQSQFFAYVLGEKYLLWIQQWLCAKCITFWWSWWYAESLFVAAMAALFAVIIEMIIDLKKINL